VAALLCSVEIRYQMFIALAAYAAYITNATQFLLKLRAARRQSAEPQAGYSVALAGRE
jgi:3-vinyl bacteriochlorophyllide hydratase